MKKIKIEIWTIEAVPCETYPEYDCGYNHGPHQILTINERELDMIDPETHDYRII